MSLTSVKFGLVACVTGIIAVASLLYMIGITPVSVIQYFATGQFVAEVSLCWATLVEWVTEETASFVFVVAFSISFPSYIVWRSTAE